MEYTANAPREGQAIPSGLRGRVKSGPWSATPPGRPVQASPHDTAAALRLLKVLVECRQMDPGDAEEWGRRIEGWARFSAVEAGTRPRAGSASVWGHAPSAAAPPRSRRALRSSYYRVGGGVLVRWDST